MLFALLSLAFAQSEEPAPAPAPLPVQLYKPVTEVDFEGQRVHGQLYGPSISLLPERKAGHFNSLIQLRASFDDELDHSVDELR
ncbi:MAG: hypothetical protein ACOZNI_10275 [Myxococcota bacterium]